MVQSATDTRSVMMNNNNNYNIKSDYSTISSCFPYVIYTPRNAHKSEHCKHPHKNKQQHHHTTNTSNVTSLPAPRATTASLVGNAKTNTNRFNTHSDTKKEVDNVKINNVTQLGKSNSNVEAKPTTKTRKQEKEQQKEEIGNSNNLWEQEEYRANTATSTTEIDGSRRSTLLKQRDEVDKAHHLQFLKLCGKIGPKPWRHSNVAEEQEDDSIINETNGNKKREKTSIAEDHKTQTKTDIECKELSHMSSDAVRSSPSSLPSSSSSSSTPELPVCNTNKYHKSEQHCLHVSSNNRKKKNYSKNVNCNRKKELTDVDATDEDVYELVYGVGTCGYLQQVTQRAQRQALPFSNWKSTYTSDNNNEEGDQNKNDNKVNGISGNKYDKPLPTIQCDKVKKSNVFDRLRKSNNKNTYTILNAACTHGSNNNNNKNKKDELLPPLAISRADHPLAIQPITQRAFTTLESTFAPTCSATPESSSSMYSESLSSMYAAPSNQSRNSLSSAIVGGQMDVFGYFATHRVFPHYYDTLQTRFYSTRIAESRVKIIAEKEKILEHVEQLQF